MSKRFRFLYRYLTTPNRWRQWVTPQTLLVIAVAAVFLAAMIWTKPPSVARATSVATPAVSTATPAPGQTASTPKGPVKTPLPPEYLNNADQTIGITLAGAMLVLIVVAGVLTFLPRETRGK